MKKRQIIDELLNDPAVAKAVEDFFYRKLMSKWADRYIEENEQKTDQSEKVDAAD